MFRIFIRSVKARGTAISLKNLSPGLPTSTYLGTYFSKTDISSQMPFPIMLGPQETTVTAVLGF